METDITLNEVHQPSLDTMHDLSLVPENFLKGRMVRDDPKSAPGITERSLSPIAHV